MIIKQISVHIKNKAGYSWQVFQALADQGINILSYSIADSETQGEGILRLIVDNIKQANKALQDAGFEIQLHDVYSLNCPNEPGAMAKVLHRLAQKGISINYMYAFQYMGISQSIIHAQEMEQLKSVLSEYEKERLL